MNKYIPALSRRMRGRPFGLYMDQLWVHKSKASVALYQKFGITDILNLSYQPDLNPIEACFS